MRSKPSTWLCRLVLVAALAAAGAALGADQLRIAVKAASQTAATGPLSDLFAGRDDTNQPLGSLNWTNSAQADYGKLGASSRMSLNYALAQTSTTFAQAGWQANYSFISPTGLDVPVSMNLVLDASMFFQDTCGNGHAGCELTLTIDANFLGVGDLMADNGALTRSSGFLTPVASQFHFDGSRFIIPLTTNTAFVFGNGTPIPFSLNITVGTLVGVNGGGATTKFDLSTLTFPIGGIAFNVPPGTIVIGPGLIDNCFGGAVPCGPPCGGYADVDSSNAFCANIEWITDRRITLGCAPGQFCPVATASRQEMAAFMNRLGTAMTDVVFPVHAQPGAIDLDASPVVCQTADFAVVDFPRRAVVDGVVSGQGAGDVSFVADAVASFDAGSTWAVLTSTNVAGSATTAHWGNVRATGVRDLDVGQTVRFGLRVGRGDFAGSSDLSASECNARVRIGNRVTDYSPYDR